MLVTECSMSDNVQSDNPNVEFIKPLQFMSLHEENNARKDFRLSGK